MRILFVNGHLGVGGVEKSLVDLLKCIDYTKNKVDLLLFEGYGEYLSQIPTEVNIILKDLHPLYGSCKSVIMRALRYADFRTILLKIIFTLYSHWGTKYIRLLKLLMIQPFKYDYAIAYRMGICADYVGYAVSAKEKFVWWHHGEFDYDSKTIKDWRNTIKKFDKMICVSESSRQLIMPYFQDVVKKIMVIPNMINTIEIKKKATEFHPYEGKRGKILVSVGRLSPEKMMINAVYAMKELVRRGITDVMWYLVGDGNEREKIEREIINNNLQGKIICVGNKSNPYPYIADADIFVHPSYVESQGITVLEAFALAKLCLVTDSAGTREFVVDGKNAIVAEQSVESLVEHLIKMLTENTEKYNIDFQRQTVNQFSPELISKKITKLIEE